MPITIPDKFPAAEIWKMKILCYERPRGGPQDIRRCRF